jgi:hypothetical protein
MAKYYLQNFVYLDQFTNITKKHNYDLHSQRFFLLSLIVLSANQIVTQNHCNLTTERCWRTRCKNLGLDPSTPSGTVEDFIAAYWTGVWSDSRTCQIWFVFHSNHCEHYFREAFIDITPSTRTGGSDACWLQSSSPWDEYGNLEYSTNCYDFRTSLPKAQHQTRITLTSMWRVW